MRLKSIAFIPDGNRRFAKEKNISLAESYNLGTQKARNVMEWLVDYPKIKTGTFYTLSSKNLNRNKFELKLLFKMFEKELDFAKTDKMFEENGISLRFIGRLNMLPKHISNKMREVEKITENFSEKIINLAVGYDGQSEIVDAAKNLAIDYKKNKIDLNNVNEENFSKYLYSSMNPDLLIRTGKTKRLSGFLTYQSSYSELFFCDKYWPDFEKTDLKKAVEQFNSKNRRFGK